MDNQKQRRWRRGTARGPITSPQPLAPHVSKNMKPVTQFSPLNLDAPQSPGRWTSVPTEHRTNPPGKEAKDWKRLALARQETTYDYRPMTNSAAWQHEHEHVNTTTRWDNCPLQVIDCPYSNVSGPHVLVCAKDGVSITRLRQRCRTRPAALAHSTL